MRRSVWLLLCMSLVAACAELQPGSLGRQGDGDQDLGDDSVDAPTPEQESALDAGTRPVSSRRDAGIHADAGAARDAAASTEKPDAGERDAGSDAGQVSAHCMREPWECP